MEALGTTFSIEYVRILIVRLCSVHVDSSCTRHLDLPNLLDGMDNVITTAQLLPVFEALQSRNCIHNLVWLRVRKLTLDIKCDAGRYKVHLLEVIPFFCTSLVVVVFPRVFIAIRKTSPITMRT